MKKLFKKIFIGLTICLAALSLSSCSIDIAESGWINELLCDHVFDEEEILKEATCGEDGRKLKVCSACGKTKTVTIKATGAHAWEEETLKEATCGEGGQKIKTCSICGKTETVTIEATGAHVYSETLTYNETHHWYPCFICGGAEEEMLIEHTLKKSHDDDYHWFTCSDGCGYQSEKEEHTGSYEYVGTPYPSYVDSHQFKPDCCNIATPTKKCDGEWKTVGTIGVDVKDVKICKCGKEIGVFNLANVDEDGNEIVTEINLNVADIANDETETTFSLVMMVREEILEQGFYGFEGLFYKGELLYDEDGIQEHFMEIPATIFGNVLGEHILELVMLGDPGRTEIHALTLKINVINIHNHVDEDIDYTCDDCGADYYIFEDESKYTEVDVSDGELVAGNWYRLYRPANESRMMTRYNLNVDWIGSFAEATISFGACPWETSGIQCGSDGYTGYLYAFGSSGKVFKEMKCWITEDYIDVYIEAGTYTFEDMPEATATITSETTITLGDYGAYIKRLVVN